MPSCQLSPGDAVALQFLSEFEGENHWIAECLPGFRLRFDVWKDSDDREIRC